MKARSDAEIVGAGALDRDVKLGTGGIREIEFVAQSLQLLNAGALSLPADPFHGAGARAPRPLRPHGRLRRRAAGRDLLVPAQDRAPAADPRGGPDPPPAGRSRGPGGDRGLARLRLGGGLRGRPRHQARITRTPSTRISSRTAASTSNSRPGGPSSRPSRVPAAVAARIGRWFGADPKARRRAADVRLRRPPRPHHPRARRPVPARRRRLRRLPARARAPARHAGQARALRRALRHPPAVPRVLRGEPEAVPRLFDPVRPERGGRGASLRPPGDHRGGAAPGDPAQAQGRPGPGRRHLGARAGAPGFHDWLWLFVRAEQVRHAIGGILGTSRRRRSRPR